MTRFDAYVKTLILKHLHMQDEELNPWQKDLIQMMMNEIYENQKLKTMEIEHKVRHITDAYRPKLNRL